MSLWPGLQQTSRGPQLWVSQWLLQYSHLQALPGRLLQARRCRMGGQVPAGSWTGAWVPHWTLARCCAPVPATRATAEQSPRGGQPGCGKPPRGQARESELFKPQSLYQTQDVPAVPRFEGSHRAHSRREYHEKMCVPGGGSLDRHFLSSLYTWGNRGPERSSDLPAVSQPVTAGLGWDRNPVQGGSSPPRSSDLSCHSWNTDPQPKMQCDIS